MWKGSFSRLKDIFLFRFACVCCCCHGCCCFRACFSGCIVLLLNFCSCFSCVLAIVVGNCCGAEASNSKNITNKRLLYYNNKKVYKHPRIRLVMVPLGDLAIPFHYLILNNMYVEGFFQPAEGYFALRLLLPPPPPPLLLLTTTTTTTTTTATASAAIIASCYCYCSYSCLAINNNH